LSRGLQPRLLALGSLGPRKRRWRGRVLGVGHDAGLDRNEARGDRTGGSFRRRKCLAQRLHAGEVARERQAARLSNARELHLPEVEADIRHWEKFVAVELIEELGAIGIVARSGLVNGASGECHKGRG
jgi:hypothetical protein